MNSFRRSGKFDVYIYVLYICYVSVWTSFGFIVFNRSLLFSLSHSIEHPIFLFTDSKTCFFLISIDCCKLLAFISFTAKKLKKTLIFHKKSSSLSFFSTFRIHPPTSSHASEYYANHS